MQEGITVTPVVLPACATDRQWDVETTILLHDPNLTAALDEALGGVTGQIALAVEDLDSRGGALPNATGEMPAASLFKLPVLYSTYRSGISPGETLEVTERIKEYDLGTLSLEVGDTLAVGTALEGMVTISDNSSAIMLSDRIGPWRVIADLEALGLSSTHFLEERLTTSALDMMTLLELMARGEAVSPQASDEMIGLLLRQRINDRLPRLLPETARVAHKTGNLPGVVNDVGIIFGERSAVIVAALISDSTDEAEAATAIARVALAAHEYFERQLETFTLSTPPRPLDAGGVDHAP